MTANMKGNEKFADVDAVAATIVKAIDKKKDTLYVQVSGPRHACSPNIPEFILKN